MPLIKTAEHLAKGAVSTASHVARHPVSSVANVFGFAKGIASSGASLRHAEPPQQRHADAPAPDEATEASEAPEAKEAPAAEKAPAAEQTPAANQPPAPQPEIDLPGPDIVLRGVPDPADLPEPIVIEADDSPGESFHTEPKAGSRASEHEGAPGDREEVEGYLEEVVDTEAPDVDIETPVGTTGADVGFNPDTAESDLQQPATPALLDPATAKSVRSESRTLKDAADDEKG